MSNKSQKYLGNSNLKASGVKINFSDKQVTEYMKCANDPVYFIKNYVKIVSLDKGTIPFELYDFQEKMVKGIHNNRFVIAKCPRQSGKSTTVTSYILHHILFNQNMSVAILANKLTTARELLGRLKMAYEFLPMWLQQGVIEWNKGSIVLENGSKVLASATSSSAIRGGSFNCIAGESIVTIRDPKTGGIFNISIEELYANSSRNNQNDIYRYGNDRKQIQEVVFFPYGEGSKSCHGRRDFHGEASHSSKIAWRRQQNLQHCGADNTGTSISTSTSTALLEWNGEGEDVSCIPYDGDGETGTTSKIAINCYIGIEEKLFRGKKINANWNETFRGNEKENILLTQGSQEFGRNSSENIKGKQRSFLGIDSTKGIWGTSVQTVHGNKEDQRTLGQNQQESRENSKDGREASWNETISRSKGENEIGGSSKNRATGWCLEQGNEDGRWQVLTHNGFKKFHGISKAPTQKTIKVTFDNDQEIVCTTDHKIFSVNRGSVVAESLCVGEFVEGDGRSVEVVGVEEYGVRDVYDLLEVEEHHSYYANGIRIANCILLDEFAYVPQNVAEEFFSSVYPTITSGKTTKVVMTSTPNGLNMFYKLWVNANKQVGEEGKNEYFPIEVSWRDIPGRDEAWKLQTIANTSEQQFNTEFNCEFLGSLHTLILPDKIKALAYKTPIYFNADGLRMYERPTPNHTYVLVADTARGQGKDYHAFTVVDVTQMPYVVVATFRNNIMPPMLYPNAIYAIARQYNKAYVLVEINDIGQQVADILHKDLEYDNIVHVQMQGRKGQVVNGGFGTAGSSMMGVKTSVATKRIGCAILKSLVEDSKLIVNDFGIIDEFCSFVASAESFEAEEGHNDDLVMSLVLFSWLSSQEYFKQMTGNDIRKDLYEEQIKHLEEEMTPFGFIDDGQAEIGYVDGSGTLWKTEDARNIDNMWF
jgi:hypothetical protein